LNDRADLAASTEQTRILALEHGGQSSGSNRRSGGRTVAFHRTPGYETYRGLGWYAALVQSDR
jgi:hypothetical protein